MDIVDINKVLDDLEVLELNEEQHSKLNKGPAAHEGLSGRQNDLFATYKYGPTAPESPSVSTMATATPTPQLSGRITKTKTNFVKVSNVFNR